MNPKASGTSAAQGQPECCCVFVFYNQEHEVEHLLQPFLEALAVLPLQILIYDDGSTDGTPFVIESLIGQAESDHIIFHKHDLRRGIGQCLNLALEDCSTKAFYYVDKHSTLKTEVFASLLRELSFSQAAFTFPASNPALDPTQLAIKHASKKKVPASINYIIRKDRIRPDRLFFNPFLHNGHSAEMLMRAGVSAKALEAPTFFQLSYNEEVYSDLTTQDSRLIMFHSQLSDSEVRGVGSNEDPDLLYEKAEALKSDGRIAAALELCDDILKRFPGHQNSLRLSVELLKRLKKYIEASERSKMIGRDVTRDEKESAPEIDNGDSTGNSTEAPTDAAESEPESDIDQTSGIKTEHTSGAEDGTGSHIPEPQTATAADDDGDEETEVGYDEDPAVDEQAAGREETDTLPEPAGIAQEAVKESAAETDSDAETETANPETKAFEEDAGTEPYADTDTAAQHDTGAETKEEPEAPYERPDHFRHSIVVPVAGFAMQAFEDLVTCLHNFCDPSDTELIIVDNACLDDTWEYLQEMQAHHFFHVRIITNTVNKGVSHALNQGIQAAEGDYVVVMHADVTFKSDVVRQLSTILEHNPEAALAGPVTTNAMQEEQVRAVAQNPEEVLETNWVDGFCLAMRAADENRFDERFHFAWYETTDLCYRKLDEGHKILIATGVLVNHAYGTFTRQLGVSLYSDEFLRSLDVFTQKWIGEAEVPELSDAHPLEQIWQLGETVDPLKPSKKIQEKINALLTDRLATELKNLQDVTDYDLRNFIRALMAVNNRGLMRDLEELLSSLPDPGFGVELLAFYYRNQIFSRCRKYIDMLQDQLPHVALMYALRIAWKENDIETASTRLAEYLEAYPASAEAHFIAAKLYERQGGTEQAAAFMERAQTLDPSVSEES
ncbi:Tetratricopeptide repeat-containing protein [Cyclonatronum proteinivorum]|uniref:Tetratricopeptide repeat-containing protein n=1 Tax=Cyclonatronum proteinivorum TaxID=1457365 RepID=A0A345UPL3_9BACT|nr:glycosyltransferase [Cyclonatronum proteinivorum]AXJ02415.1 Tetratricopeptide repeat-containing protein [Cyclonatronum proteinivorum]